MNLQTVLACAVIIFVFRLYRNKQQVQQEESEYFDALELSDAVQELEKVMEQLENADRMAVDIDTCEPGMLHRFFRTSWMSSDGKNRTLELCTTGKDRTTRGLAIAARAERDRLNQEVIDRIRAIALALETGDSTQADFSEPLPDAQSMDETAGQSGKNGGRNDYAALKWGSE